jgi:hypothetical protein
MVSYFWPAVNISLLKRAAITQPLVAHEITVVIDATSGQFLEPYIWSHI